jgi:ribosomal protein S27AE
MASRPFQNYARHRFDARRSDTTRCGLAAHSVFMAFDLEQVTCRRCWTTAERERAAKAPDQQPTTEATNG